MAREFIEDFVKKLSNAVNSYSSDDDTMSQEIAELISREHRTLQQNMIKVLFNGLVKYGNYTGVDGRNRCAVDACKEIGKIDSHFPLI